MALTFGKAFLLKQLRIGSGDAESVSDARDLTSLVNYASSTKSGEDTNSMATSLSDSSVSPNTTPRLTNRVSFEIGEPDDESSLTEGAQALSPLRRTSESHEISNIEDEDSDNLDPDATPQAFQYLSDDSDLELIAEAATPAISVEEGLGTLSAFTLEFTKQDPDARLPANKSLLSSAITTFAGSDPLAQFATSAVGSSPENNLLVKLYFNFSDQPSTATEITVRKDAQVHLIIGYALHVYAKSHPLDNKDPNQYNLRLVEEDGEPDEDFPALERKRPIYSYSVDEIVLVLATPQEYEQNKKDTPFKVTTVADQPGVDKNSTVAVKVYMFPMDNNISKVYWTKDFSGSDLVGDVLSAVCKEKSLGEVDYALRVVGSRLPVELGMGLISLKPQPVAIIEPTSTDDEGELVLLLELVPQRAIREDESFRSPVKRKPAKPVTSTTPIMPAAALSFQKFGYYKYKVWRRQHVAFLGRQERELAIDGEYVYIMPPTDRSLLEQPKTTTFHIRQVIRCKKSSKSAIYCKIFVMKQTGPKRYDIDCQSAADCSEIVTRINRLMRAN